MIYKVQNTSYFTGDFLKVRYKAEFVIPTFDINGFHCINKTHQTSFLHVIYAYFVGVRTSLLKTGHVIAIGKKGVVSCYWISAFKALLAILQTSYLNSRKKKNFSEPYTVVAYFPQEESSSGLFPL